VTWTAETSCGYEAAKIASIAVPYLQGRFLDLGCGLNKVWPSALGVDNGGSFGRGAADIAADISDLSLFTDASFDAVFSSHALEDFTREHTPAILAEWLRVIKIGGHLVLYLPSANLYPKMGEDGANTAHRQDIFPGEIEAILKDWSERNDGLFGLTLLESEERGGSNEYSLFIVVQKTITGGWTENVWQRNPDGKKRALVCRFGAIGDQIQAASVLPELRKQGYHVTYNTTPKGQQAVLHDPHVDGWLIQETDYVPNMELGSYFNSLAERYDLFVNLCESVEATLLAMPGRINHQYPVEVRRKLSGHVNYLERTHDLAGVPHVFHPRFYALKEELATARKWRQDACGDAPVVYWAINGSSYHKIWPYIHIVAHWILDKTPFHIVMTADGNMGKKLQEGIIAAMGEHDASRIHGMAGVWSIRQSLTFAQIADCVVGPETGILNGVCMEPMPKVVYLSHSSPDNLTKHWKNTTTLIPPAGTAECYPCHRLHPDWTFCNKNEEAQAAQCAVAIRPERVFEAIAVAMGAIRLKEAAD
jgi:ADP-heptose:LPS heptosyltransferase